MQNKNQNVAKAQLRLSGVKVGISAGRSKGKARQNVQISRESWEKRGESTNFASKYNNTMIRSIPNPPMDRVDVTRFRQNLEKLLRGDFNAEERHHIEARQARTKANAQRIIENCGGKNPLLGY